MIIKDHVCECDAMYYSKEREVYYFRWDSIKWDDRFGAFIDKLVADNDNDCSLVRIGEDLDDMESRGCYGDHEVQISRTIEFYNGDELDIDDIFLCQSIQYIKED